jgi:prepilin-type N-terminal cleavage/methylation domain-containing protein
VITRPATFRKKSTGFTLLELVIAIALLGILVGMVMSTANSSLKLGNNIVETQNEEMLHQAFIEFLDHRFGSLPGNTRFDVKVEDSGKQYLSTLTLQKVPLGFTWGGQERIAKAVQLSTVRRRSGFLDIVLSYYENEILENSDAPPAGTSSAQVKTPFAEITLLEDVRYFEWKFLDGTTMEWRYDWDVQGRLPLQIELVFAFGAEGQEIRQIFWMPTKQNPEVLVREMMQNNGGGTAADTGGGGGAGRPNGGGANGGGGRPNGGGGAGRPNGGGGGGAGRPNNTGR